MVTNSEGMSLANQFDIWTRMIFLDRRYYLLQFHEITCSLGKKSQPDEYSAEAAGATALAHKNPGAQKQEHCAAHKAETQFSHSRRAEMRLLTNLFGCSVLRFEFNFTIGNFAQCRNNGPIAPGICHRLSAGEKLLGTPCGKPDQVEPVRFFI